MKAHLNMLAICLAVAAGAAPSLAAAASCNDQHATCQQRGGSEERCLAAWHQCRMALAHASNPVRPAPAPASKLVAVSTHH